MTHLTFLVAWVFSLPGLNRRVPFYIFSFWILFLFLALRYGYGNDYWSYYNKHDLLYLTDEPFWKQKEVLFTYLNLLVSNFYLMVAIISLFYIFTMHNLIKRNLEVKQYWLALILLLVNPYLFLIHLSSLRQTIAICLFIFAVNFSVKRKPLLYFSFVLIAAGFHKSALLLIPLYFVLNERKLNKKGVIVTCGLLAALLGTPLFDSVMNHLLGYFPNYNDYVEQAATISLRSTLISGFLFLLVILNINKLEGKELIFGKLALISTTLSVLCIKVAMLTRVVMYFDIFMIIALPLILSKIKVKANRKLLTIAVIMIYLLRYVSFFSNPMWNAAYGTYKTILGE